MSRVALLALCAALAGCGERAQTKTAEDANARDTPPWQGAKSGYMVPGWNAGNQTAWDTQLRRRTQNQNEFVKAN